MFQIHLVICYSNEVKAEIVITSNLSHSLTPSFHGGYIVYRQPSRLFLARDTGNKLPDPFLDFGKCRRRMIIAYDYLGIILLSGTLVVVG